MTPNATSSRKCDTGPGTDPIRHRRPPEKQLGLFLTVATGASATKLNVTASKSAVAKILREHWQKLGPFALYRANRMLPILHQNKNRNFASVQDTVSGCMN